jgi:putative membrane protein
MGSADAVPGVSGGTIALIVGIYERLIAAVTAVNPARARRVLGGVRPGGRADAREAFREVDGAFLLVLGAGIGTAVITVLSAVNRLLVTQPVATYGFFFGLIAASAAVLLDDVDLATPRRKAAAVAGFTLAFLASGVATTALGSPLPVIFFAGGVAVSAMVLPGISGSLLLIVLGQYEYMSGVVARFVDAVGALALGNGTDALVETLPPVATFLLGGVGGLFTIAHAVRYALSRARAATLAFLVSLVLGALRAPLVEVAARLAESGESWQAAAPRFALAALVGAGLVAVLNQYSATIEY